MSGTPLSATYTVTVTDAYGCSADTTAYLFVQSVPSVTWAQWDPALTCDGILMPLNANVSANGQYVYWDFGDGTTIITYPPNTNAPPHLYPYNGTYTVTLIVHNPPCKDTLDTTLVVPDILSYINLMETNVFTPNGDGINDFFHPAICNLSAATPATPCPQDSLANQLSECLYLEVFDRWGIKMFETTDNEKFWDGKTRGGSDAHEGTYYYIAKFGKNITIRGFVTLLR
jgi:gliding motility-associated-like protein